MKTTINISQLSKQLGWLLPGTNDCVFSANYTRHEHGMGFVNKLKDNIFID